MKKLCFKILLISLALIISPAISCSQNKSKSKDQSRIQVNAQLETDVDVERNVITGAERTELYFPLIEGKRVAVMSNQTGMVGNEHLVDMLIRRGHNVVGIFSPEHGFRGTADAGEHVSSSVDKKTGTPIWSLYGSGGGKPSADNMKEIGRAHV